MTKEENEKRLAYLKGIVARLPEKPGSYQFYDDEHTIIYVGKAKSLKARVSSYFHTEVDRFKTKVLVSKIHDISYTVVNTEEDALLLENSLIKKYNPRYNVLLKDGKTYPSICVTNEPFPRIFKTRTINKKWGTYYGPYSHIGSMYAVLELINKLYKPRTCRQPITKEGISARKYQVCLEYHIKNCYGPCVAKQSYEDYQENIRQAREILKGNTRQILREMREEMERLAENLEFEKAEEIKQKYLLIDSFVSKSEVVSHTINNVDVVSITSDDKTAYINYIHVSNGSINQSFTIEYKKKMDETDEELLSTVIPTLHERTESTAREAVLPFHVADLPEEYLKQTVPTRGDRLQLLELSLRNVKAYQIQCRHQRALVNPDEGELHRKHQHLLERIQKALNLPMLPVNIECFDNSNIQGAYPVAAMVRFTNGKPNRKEYRKFNIKTVEGPDDYASMAEVIFRRYKRLSDEGQPLPQLLVVDGGAGQMEVARQVIQDQLQLEIPIAGLAKDDRHHTSELLYGFPPKVVGLKPTDPLFHLLEQIQNEVHRFAITFHKDKRSKGTFRTQLTDIPGIGDKTARDLLLKFGSVKEIKLQTEADLAKVVGPAKAKAILAFFATQQD